MSVCWADSSAYINSSQLKMKIDGALSHNLQISSLPYLGKPTFATYSPQLLNDKKSRIHICITFIFWMQFLRKHCNALPVILSMEATDVAKIPWFEFMRDFSTLKNVLCQPKSSIQLQVQIWKYIFLLNKYKPDMSDWLLFTTLGY